MEHTENFIYMIPFSLYKILMVMVLQCPYSDEKIKVEEAK